MIIRDAELRGGNILDSVNGAPRDVQHLRPAVIRRVDRRDGCVAHARQCAHAREKSSQKRVIMPGSE